MKIRNKYDGTTIESLLSIKEEYYFYRLISLGNCSILFKRDGWEEATDTNVADKWRKIERDKNGFATEECLDEMFSSIPIAIRSKDNDYYAIGETDNLEDWRGDIEIHPFYTHWMKLSKFEEE